MMALRRAICWTPSASVMVTSAGSPSGIAATAKPMVAEISSPAGMPCSTLPIATMTTAITAMISDSFLPKAPICLVSGVSKASISASMVVIRPISACAPVAVTTPTPCPAETSDDENSIDDRSPMPAPAATAPTCLPDGTASPVSAASSTRRLLASSSRMSAGTFDPAETRTTSPGTSCSVGTRTHSPSRRTCASADNMFLMPASACSARPSWTKPMTALIRATVRITQKSIHSPSAAFSVAAASRM